jgi:DNA polymerase III subunit epsilon
MKSPKKKYILKPTKPTFVEIIRRLKKEPIEFLEFLSLLENYSERLYESSDLEFELLLLNGFPLEIKDNFVYLNTTKEPISSQTFCFVDIETNGGNPQKGHQIIELGAVKYRDGKIVDKFDTLVFAKELPPYIQTVTNISLEMLKTAPRVEKVLKEFKEFLGNDVFVAHDIKFDYNFISQSFEKYSLGKLLNRKLCTIDLAKRTIASPKYGLSTLKELLDIKVANHHRAYFDALATKEIFEKCLENINQKTIKTSEDLIAFSKSNNIIKLDI